MALIPLALSLLCGLLSGLGVGGGSLLLLWLLGPAGFAPEEARSLNLLFFLTSAAPAVFRQSRRDLFDRNVVLPAAAAGCAVSVLVLRGSAAFSGSQLRIGYGLLLCGFGLRELLVKPPQGRPSQRSTEASG